MSTLPASEFGVVEEIRSPLSGIYPGQSAVLAGSQQGPVRDLVEVLGDRPEVPFGGHPAEGVEAGEVHRPPVAAHRPFTAQVEVVLEVGHGQLAQAAVYRLPVAQAGELAGSDRTPAPAAPEDRDHVVLVTDAGEVHDQGRLAVDAEGGGRQDCALDAVRRTVPQDPAGRAERLPVLLAV